MGPLPPVLVRAYPVAIQRRLDRVRRCVRFDDNSQGTTVQAFLYDDISIRCSWHDRYSSYDSSEHASMRLLASFFIAIWPVGVPMMFTGLLVAERRAIKANHITPLERATRFLHQDYKPDF